MDTRFLLMKPAPAMGTSRFPVVYVRQKMHSAMRMAISVSTANAP